MPNTFVEKRWCVFVRAALVACSELESLGARCVFNDDCAAPLVCAGHRCRARCRSARDAPALDVAPFDAHPHAPGSLTSAELP